MDHDLMSAAITAPFPLVRPTGAVATSQRALRPVSSIFAVLCLIISGLVLIPAALGYHRFVITGGSMNGTIPKGSLAFASQHPAATLKAGDIITFTPPGQWANNGLVTHRISSITRDSKGQRVFHTKGDNNKSVDPWTFVPVADQLPRYSFHVPLAGYPVAALSIKPIRLLLLGLPALIMAISVIIKVWRKAGEQMALRETSVAFVGPAERPVSFPQAAPASVYVPVMNEAVSPWSGWVSDDHGSGQRADRSPAAAADQPTGQALAVVGRHDMTGLLSREVDRPASSGSSARWLLAGAGVAAAVAVAARRRHR
jgi:signal peptidase